MLLEAGYFTVASLLSISVPRLRVPSDLAAAIGVGLLAAQLIGRRTPEEPAPIRAVGAAWSRRTKILVTLSVIVAVTFAAGGVALARNRVEDNAESQLHRKIDDDSPAVKRLARFDADSLVAGSAAPSKRDYKEADALADKLWLLSPRFSGKLRSESRDAARTLDQAIFELKVLDLVTSGNRSPGTPPPAALDASRATYDTQARPSDARLPAWNTISANPAMRRVATDLDRLEHQLSRT